MSPVGRASFTFHLLDLVEDKPRRTDVPTLAEMRALSPVEELCIYGEDDRDSPCPQLAGTPFIDVVRRAGGHRTHDYETFSDLILEALAATT